MNTWLRDLESTINAERRDLCASAALHRASSPPVNLAGLDNTGTTRRRTVCLNAALARFVAEPKPSVGEARVRTAKRTRRSSIVHDTLLQLVSGDKWSPIICGYGHLLKRHRVLRLGDISVK